MKAKLDDEDGNMGVMEQEGDMARADGGRAPRSGATVLWQMYALLFKNAVLAKRQYIASCVHLLAPAVLVVMFGIVLKVIAIETTVLHPEPIMTIRSELGGELGRCAVYDSYGGRFGYGGRIKNAPCQTLVYSPSTPAIKAIMTDLAKRNQLDEQDVRGFASTEELREFLISGDLPTMAAVVFPDDGSLYKDVAYTNGVHPHTHLKLDSDPGVMSLVSYEVWYNQTVENEGFSSAAGLDEIMLQTMAYGESESSTVLVVERAVNEAMLAAHTGSDESKIDVQLKAFPKPPNSRTTDSRRGFELEVTMFGSVFYMVGIMLSFMIALRQIVQEKEDKILDGLRMMGLYESVYWLSWLVYYAVMMAVSAGLMVATGIAMDIPFFVHASGMWLFLLFFSFLLSMMALAMAMSTLIPSSRVASIVGFLLLAVGIIFQLTVVFLSTSPSANLMTIISDPFVMPAAAKNLINLYPPLLFTKMERNVAGMIKPRYEEGEEGETAEIFGDYTFSDSQAGVYQNIDVNNPKFQLNRSETVSAEFVSAQCAEVPDADSSWMGFVCYQHEEYCYDNSPCYLRYDAPVLEPTGCAERSSCRSAVCSRVWRYSATEAECDAVGGSFATKEVSFETYLEGDTYGPGDAIEVNTTATYCACRFETDSDASSLGWLWFDILFWVGFAWYVGQVITFGHGKPEKAWFLFTPAYWIGGSAGSCAGAGAVPTPDSGDKDADVAAEEAAIRSGDRSDPAQFPVVLRDLVKDFGGRRLCCGSPSRAVNGLTLALEQGSCFALLGHNGAGKTTAINMLSGMISMSGGDCTIFGKSVRDNMAAIRHEIGVCPQHDILWSSLTAREHMRFYGHFQGMSMSEVRKQSNYLLKQVHLDKLKRVAGNFSGGMKRRLSMAIAALGNKRVVFLDEPTTGLDPQNQRHVWDMINELKQDRVVILTTHLMDEADMLGDRIGIMSKGRLVALGNPLHLKSKFGGNYKVMVSPSSAEARQTIQTRVLAALPGVVADEDNLSGGDTGSMLYTIKPSLFGGAPALFREVDAIVASGEAKDWGLSQTSLEDVFVSLDEQPQNQPMMPMAVPAQGALQGQFPTAMAVDTKAGAADVQLQQTEEFDDSVQFHRSTRGQVRALIRKSFVLQMRQRKTVCCQLFTPLLMIGLMFGLTVLIENQLTQRSSYDDYDDEFSGCAYCIWDAGSEYTNVYAPNYQEDNVADYCNFCPDFDQVNATTVPAFAEYAALAETYGSDLQDYYSKASAKDALGPAWRPEYMSNENPLATLCKEKGSCRPRHLQDLTYKQADAEWVHPFVQSETRYSDVIGAQRKLMVATTKDALKAEVGSRCGSIDIGTISNKSCSGCSGDLVDCYGSSPEQPALTSSSCVFSNSSVATDVLGPAFEAWNATGSSLMAAYPYAAAIYSGETELRVRIGPNMCPVDNFASTATLNEQARGREDESLIVNEAIFNAQTELQKVFPTTPVETFEEQEALRDLISDWLPAAALIFDDVDVGKGVLSLTIQTYIASPYQYPCDDYPGAFFPAPGGNEDIGYYSRCEYGPDGTSYDYEVDLQLLQSVLGGVATATLRTATPRADSPLGGATEPFIVVGNREFPMQAQERDSDLYVQESIAAAQQLLAGFLVPFATSFLLPVLTFHIVHEKEHKLRALMLMMGLRMRVYWAVQYVFDLALTMTMLTLVYILGTAFGLDVMANHQFGIVLLTFFLWANAMIGLAFLFSAFFSRSRNSSIFLYFIVLVSVVASVFVNQQYFAQRPFEHAPGWWMWFPLFAYYRAIFLLSSRSFFWEDLDGSDELVMTWLYLFVEAIVCFTATLYLDQVLPKQFGVRRGPLFCITDLLGAAKGSRGKGDKGLGEEEDDFESVPEDLEALQAGEDADVVAERRLVRSRDGSARDAPIRVVNVRKQFGSFVAVDGVDMHMQDKALFALLGPNGAGKSTLISMLTGLFGPSGGDAFVDNMSIRHDMQSVYNSIGVCPQHDVTWPDMTVAEHLLLFARLKGVSRADEKRVVQNALRAVQLEAHGRKRSRYLSGGQRRRLSIAISFLGNPKVAFLDEPTTGVDPVTRAHVHDLVLRERRRRCVVLTTHLMSEAEKLSDRIGIMAHGKLKTIGTSAALKAKYNEGFSLIVVASDAAAAQNFVESQMSGAKLESQVNRRLVFRMEPSASLHLADVWEIMAAGAAKSNGISDWQISATTLEDVFIKIASQSEATFGTA